MPRFPLQTLLDLSQSHLDAATRQLGTLIAGEQQAEERLKMLVEYRAEYHSRFIDAAKSGLGREAWANFQRFLGRLDEAIEQANGLVAASKQKTKDGQQDWISKRGRVKAFDTLAQRHQSREDYSEQKREQKSSDEHSARLAGQKPDE